MLDYFDSGEAKGLAATSRSWENVDKPVMKSNRAKYRRELAPAEIRAFERQAFEELVRFGYPLENDAAALKAEAENGLGAATRLEYWAAETAMNARETLTSLFEDRNGAKRLRKALFVARLRLSLAAGKMLA
jgi:hypothetical protein